MKNFVIGAAIVLAILHQDFWWWDSEYLVFGFLPIGLAYHMGYSLLAAGLWVLAIKFAWPTHIEEFAEGDKPVEELFQK